MRNQSMNAKLWPRLIGVVFTIPIVVAAFVSGLYYANLHRISSIQNTTDLGVLSLDTQSRMMVIAPHCDDETLGLSGLMSGLQTQGRPVKTVFLTNGDGFRIAAQFLLKKINLTAPDFVTFGLKRQSEALVAAKNLGQRPENVSFLGFPDQGLLNMLCATGENPRAFVPTTTQSPRVPYRNTPSYNSLHSRESVLSSLMSEIRMFRPSDIYVTHPLDDHTDHAAAPVFLQIAVDRLVERKEIERPRIHWYLIHRGDWPLPQGLHRERWLVPPEAITDTRTKWTSYTLTPLDTKRKAAALNAYHSQMHVMQRMLTSFLRKNEIVTSSIDNHEALNNAEFTKEPIGDNVVRFANPSADIASVTSSVTDSTLDLAIEMAGPTSPAIETVVTLIAVSNTGSNACRIKLPRQNLLATSKTITTKFPVESLPVSGKLTSLYLQVETFALEGLLVDRSAMHRIKP